MNLKGREERKISFNEDKIQENEQFIDDVRRFVDREIKENLEIITKSIEAEKMLDEISELIAEREKFEQEKKANPRFADQIDGHIKEINEKIGNKCNKVNTSSQGKINLNPSKLTVADIDSVKNNLKSEREAESKKIDAKIRGIEPKNYKSNGFKQIMRQRIPSSTEPEKLAEEIEKMINERKIENLNLGAKNDKARANISSIQLAQANVVHKSAQSLEPTEKEIEEEIIAGDPSMALILPQTKREYQKAYYEKYLEEKGKDKEGRHPIAFLISKFGRKSRKGWKQQKEDIAEKRKEASEKIKSEKKKEMEDRLGKYKTAKSNLISKEAQFRETIAFEIMNADEQTLTDLEESAKRDEHGILTSQAYDDAEKSEDNGKEPGE